MRVILSLIVLAGCTPATAPPDAPLRPAPANHRASVDAWLQTALKDPESVRDLEVSELRQGGEWTGYAFEGMVPRHYACVTFNAKNSFGGYSGLSTYALFFEGDEVVKASEGPDPIHDTNC